MKPERKTRLMKRLHRIRWLFAAATACLLAVGLGACSSSSSSPASSSSSSGAATTGKTLVMESSPETTITQAFNPFVPTQAAYGMGATGLIYEPLIQFDLASPTISYPWLATSYAWSNSYKTITFTIRQGVKWNNGTALTPADVAFTFNMVKANTAVNSGGLNISSVSTSGNTVALTFPTSQYGNLNEIAGQAIVPKSVWSSVNPATFADPNPVGTGPYVLGSWTPQGFILKKNPNYWQASLVKVPAVDFPVYVSNTGALNALFSNQIDWTGNYIPGLQKNFVATDPAHHNYWEAAGGDESLEPNLTKWPTNQLAVRQAISLAVNRTLLASEGEAGLAAPVAEAGGLTLPTFQAWAGPVASATMSTTSNTAAAEQVLTKAGFTKGSNGYFQKGGKEVAVTIIAPTAYTDMSQVDAIAAQELRQAGINATFQGLSVDAWSADVADGNFSMTEHWSNGGISPVNMYNGWLNSTLASGSAAVGDYERLNDPAVNAELATLQGATTVSQQATALVPLEQYVAANLPIIPVTTAPEWFEYNSQNYTGWPSASNPYDSGQPSGTNNGPGSGTDEVVILHLTPR
jgi:peptide/nickel transport system substrate-binding protein